MANQLTSNAEALRLFFTEDIYLVKGNMEMAFDEQVNATADVTEAVLAPAKIAAVGIKIDVQSVSMLEEPKEDEFNRVDFKYLGKNEKQILILVNDPLNETSTVPGRELLRKLVQAIHLTVKDFALVNYASYSNSTYTQLADFFSCKLLLSFGVTTKQLALPENPLHTLFNIGETKMIFTSNLADLDLDQNSKKLLWSNLQKLN